MREIRTTRVIDQITRDGSTRLYFFFFFYFLEGKFHSRNFQQKYNLMQPFINTPSV
jgi:hypothetical protein